MEEPDDDADVDDAPPLAERTAEYVERQVGDGFRRELEHEENVVRSLPFFATSIGALLAFIGLIQDSLPPIELAVLPIAVHVLLGLTLVSLLALLWFLYDSLRRRTLPEPMNEADLVRYAEELTAYYAAASTTEPSTTGAGTHPVADRDRAVIAELRGILIEQLAAATSAIRTNNLQRLTARSRAFSTLLAALLFALVLFATILMASTVDGGLDARHDRSDPAPVDQAAAQRQGRNPAEADSATHALGGEGPVDVARGRPERSVDRPQGAPAAGVTSAARPPRLFGIDDWLLQQPDTQ